MGLKHWTDTELKCIITIIPVEGVEKDELVHERSSQSDLAVSEKHDRGQVEHYAEDC